MEQAGKITVLSWLTKKLKHQTIQKSLHLVTLMILCGFFRTLTFSTSVALFIQHYGTDLFATANIALAVFGFFFMFVTSLFSDSMRKVNYFIIAFTGFLLIWIVMIFFFDAPILPAIFYGLSFALDIFINSIRYNVADETCTVYEKRTVLPYVPLGFSIGIILGGIVVANFAGFLTGVNALIYSSVILVLTIFVAFLIRNNFKPRQEEKKMPLSDEKNAPPPFKTILKMLLTHRVIWIIIGIIIFNFFSLYYIDYLLNTEMKKQLTSSQITGFLGTVAYIRHGIVVIVNIFFVRKIMRSLGAIGMGLIKPILTVISFIPFLLVPNFWTMAGVMIAFQASETAFFVLSRRFTFNMFPANITGRLSMILEGSIAMIGVLLSGLAIFVFHPKLNPYILSIPVILILIIWIMLAFRLRHKYFKTLISNLRTKNEQLLFQSIEALVEKPTSREATMELIKTAKSLSNVETKKRIYFAIGRLGDVNALPFFINLLSSTEEPEHVKNTIYQSLPHFRSILRNAHLTRHSLMDISQDILLNSNNMQFKEAVIENLSQSGFKEIVPLLVQHLKNEDMNVRINAIRALSFFKDIGIMHSLDKLMKKGNPEEKAECVIAMWQFKEQRPFLFPIIIQLMYSTEKVALLSGINLVGRLKFHWEQKYLQQHLQNPDLDISCAAALAFIRQESEEGIVQYLEIISGDHSLTHEGLSVLGEVSVTFRSNILTAITKLTPYKINTIVERLRKTGGDFYNEIDELMNTSEKKEAV